MSAEYASSAFSSLYDRIFMIFSLAIFLKIRYDNSSIKRFLLSTRFRKIQMCVSYHMSSSRMKRVIGWAAVIGRFEPLL